MTCVAGFADGKRVWIGADSCGSDGCTNAPHAETKVFRNGPLLIGYTTSFRMGQLLRHALREPRRTAKKDALAWLVTDFINAVRKTFKEGGFATVKDGGEVGGCFLLGYRGKLYEVHADYQVSEMLHGYGAIGSGYQVALGAMHASRGKAPEERIRAALEAAAELTCFVIPPFNVLRD